MSTALQIPLSHNFYIINSLFTYRQIYKYRWYALVLATVHVLIHCGVRAGYQMNVLLHVHTCTVVMRRNPEQTGFLSGFLSDTDRNFETLHSNT